MLNWISCFYKGNSMSAVFDKATTEPLNELGREILAVNLANGWNVTTPSCWHKDYKIPAVLALITSEVSEALEGFRGDDKENFTEELADVMIRVLDCASGLGLDMDAAVRNKIEKNKTRGFRHGGKRV
jgi:NTP pyrophosphatase (non-canonical NTP hydrolase)